MEIEEEVGKDNIFIFGRTVDEVEALRAKGYNPYDRYFNDQNLRAIVDWIGSNYFTPGQGEVFAPLKHSLLDGGDPYLCLEDFADYVRAQEAVDAAYRDQDSWTRKAILNTARVGKFSSDRTIREYAEQIWKLKPAPVPVNGQGQAES